MLQKYIIMSYGIYQEIIDKKCIEFTCFNDYNYKWNKEKNNDKKKLKKGL